MFVHSSHCLAAPRHRHRCHQVCLKCYTSCAFGWLYLWKLSHEKQCIKGQGAGHMRHTWQHQAHPDRKEDRQCGYTLGIPPDCQLSRGGTPEFLPFLLEFLLVTLSLFASFLESLGCLRVRLWPKTKVVFFPLPSPPTRLIAVIAELFRAFLNMLTSSPRWPSDNLVSVKE